MNEICKLFDNAIEKKEFRNLKDDVLKLIGNSCTCDVKEKAVRKLIKKKVVMLKEKAVRKITIKKKIVMIAKIIITMIIMIMIAKMIMIMII